MLSHLPMKVSFNTRFPMEKMKFTNGYGYATKEIYSSLERLGFDVYNNNTETNVGFWFDQPQHWIDRPQWHNVGYHPWESTEVDPEWLYHMKKMDEVWTPSPLIADWYRNWGLKNVFVYEHGVSEEWTIAERKPVDKIRFLHVGGEAKRKGVTETKDAFKAAFPNNNDVELTLKMTGGIGRTQVGRIHIDSRTVSLDELIGQFHNHHVFVYPSWGEGFGLTPLQAMATAMPTITCGAWAPYQRLLDPDLTIGSELADSPWPDIHPGKMLRPNFDELVDRMRYVFDNFEDAASDALPRAHAVKEEYNWDTLTSNAFVALEYRLFEAGKISKINGL